MKPAIVALRREVFIAPVRLIERRVGHVSRRPLVRRALWFRPLRTLAGPVIRWEVVVGVVEEAIERRVHLLRSGRRCGAKEQAHTQQPGQQQPPHAYHCRCPPDLLGHAPDPFCFHSTRQIGDVRRRDDAPPIKKRLLRPAVRPGQTLPDARAVRPAGPLF